MILEFNNDAELWCYLIGGGIIVEKVGGDKQRKIYLVDGKKIYSNGESAYNCLMSYDYWTGYTN